MPSPIWPPHCCVPAFLGCAVARLAGDSGALKDKEIRRKLATAVRVTVGPTDANPWALQVSSDVKEWGVTPEAAKMRLELVESVLGVEHNLVLDFVKFNMVPFEFYEDEVTQFSRRGAVVGISFDYRELVRLSADGTEFHLTRHVARLTPHLGARRRGRSPSWAPHFLRW